MINQFKSFLLNENKHYLGQKSGDVLSALQNLQDDSEGLGNRALIRACQGIVNQIRRILHARWDEEDVKYLEHLQKVGVAIMKSIDDNEDIQGVIASSVSELEKMLEELEVPINSLGAESDAPPQEPSVSSEEPLKPGSELGT
jgi:hypothetical protein